MLIKPQEVVGGGILRPAPQSARFDVQLVAPHVSAAERSWVIPILGKDLYLDMIATQNTAVSNYNPALGALVQKFPNNPNYEGLWVYSLGSLLELCAEAVMFEALPFIGAQIGSNGVFTASGINNTPVGDAELRSLIDRLGKRCAVLQCSIKSFLNDNIQDFPLFPKPSCGTDKKCRSSLGGIIFY